MGIGAGVIEGVPVESVAGIRPDDTAYAGHDGPVYHSQNEGGGLNIPYYEIQATDDEIDIDITQLVMNTEDPVIVLYTTWGPTDFDLISLDSGTTLASEQSGFDSTGWTFVLGNVTGTLRVTNFDTDAGVDGTTAAWVPFVRVYDLE